MIRVELACFSFDGVPVKILHRTLDFTGRPWYVRSGGSLYDERRNRLRF
jgi:hypothetical protein